MDNLGKSGLHRVSGNDCGAYCKWSNYWRCNWRNDRYWTCYEVWVYGLDKNRHFLSYWRSDWGYALVYFQ